MNYDYRQYDEKYKLIMHYDIVNSPNEDKEKYEMLNNTLGKLVSANIQDIIRLYHTHFTMDHVYFENEEDAKGCVDYLNGLLVAIKLSGEYV